MTDDRTLVGQVLQGDRAAFRLLIKENQRLVTHMVGRLINTHEEREELSQDVFLKVYEKLGEFSFQSRLSTWIATIAYRHAINHLRKKKVEITGYPDEESFTTHFLATENPEGLLEDQDLNDMVLTLIEKLPVQYKSILTLYHLDGMSYPEICEITGLPEGTVKSYLFRARTLLKERIKNYLGKEEIR